MKYLTTEQFKEEFDFDTSKEWKGILKLKDDKSCVLLMSTSWCMPCKTLAPILEELEKENNFTLYKIDVDDEYELSKFFNIRSVPTILFVPINGKPIIHTGAYPKGELKKFISKYFGE